MILEVIEFEYFAVITWLSTPENGGAKPNPVIFVVLSNVMTSPYESTTSGSSQTFKKAEVIQFEPIPLFLTAFSSSSRQFVISIEIAASGDPQSHGKTGVKSTDNGSICKDPSETIGSHKAGEIPPVNTTGIGFAEWILTPSRKTLTTLQEPWPDNLWP